MEDGIDYKRFGRLIKGKRKEKKMTQQEVCDELSISNTHYSNIENGAAKPSLEVLVSLVNYYGLPLSSSLCCGERSYNTEEELNRLFNGVDDSIAVDILDVVAFADTRIYK